MSKVTKRLVDSIRPSSSDLFVWDDALPGFGLRVKPSGRKAYIIQYRTVGNISRRLTIGPHGVFTPEAARNAARELLMSARKGADPAADREAKRAALTVGDLAQRYLQRHAATKKKASSAKTDASNLTNHVLPALGRQKVAEVTRANVTRLHHNMRRTPGAANRVLALLSKMFNLAERWGVRPDGTNPCRHVERYPERKIERFLSAEELARLGRVLAEAERTGTEPPSAIAAIRILVLTGARLGEILCLQWQHVDFENLVLRLPDSKTGAKLVHLNAAAMNVLHDIPRDEHQPWVIAGAIEGRPLINLRKPWHRIRARAGLENVRIHDLRHSFASVGVASGLSLPMIGALLGHTQPVTTQRYAHLSTDPLNQAVNLIGRRIAAAMHGQGAETVDLLAWTKLQ